MWTVDLQLTITIKIFLTVARAPESYLVKSLSKKLLSRKPLSHFFACEAREGGQIFFPGEPGFGVDRNSP